MFTGIVEEVGTVREIAREKDTARLSIGASVVTADAAHGDSIAVNGVCLTVTEHGATQFGVDAVGETLRRSALGALRVGQRVNLERAAALGQRLGGHIVQGHVDGVGELLHRSEDGTTRFGMPAELSRYVVDKGSITVNGVSLTVVRPGGTEFTVALIPTTLADTTLGALRPGDRVNLEVDVLAKYLERLARPVLEG
ncbi:MAG: riboflavin synthase [Sciscionella sp.]